MSDADPADPVNDPIAASGGDLTGAAWTAGQLDEFLGSVALDGPLGAEKARRAVEVWKFVAPYLREGADTIGEAAERMSKQERQELIGLLRRLEPGDLNPETW